MNAPTWIAILSPVVGLFIAVIGGLFALGPNRAKAASDFAVAAETSARATAETTKELREIKQEIRGIKVAVEDMVDVVRVDVLPLIEGDHPHVARKLTLVKQKVEAVL